MWDRELCAGTSLTPARCTSAPTRCTFAAGQWARPDPAALEFRPHPNTAPETSPAGSVVLLVVMGDRESPWLAQQPCVIHHTSLPSSAAQRLPQSAGRWHKDGFALTNPAPRAGAPCGSDSPPCPRPAEPSQTQGRVVPSCLQGSPSDISASSFQAERGRWQWQAQPAGPEVRLSFKRHVQVLCTCKTSPSLLLRKTLGLQKSRALGTREKINKW